MAWVIFSGLADLRQAEGRRHSLSPGQVRRTAWGLDPAAAQNRTTSCGQLACQGQAHRPFPRALRPWRRRGPRSKIASRSLRLSPAPHPRRETELAWLASFLAETGCCSGFQRRCLSGCSGSIFKQKLPGFAATAPLSQLQSGRHPGPNQSRSCKDAGGRGPAASKGPALLQRLRLAELRGGQRGGLGGSRSRVQPPGGSTVWRRRTDFSWLLPPAGRRGGFYGYVPPPFPFRGGGTRMAEGVPRASRSVLAY